MTQTTLSPHSQRETPPKRPSRLWTPRNFDLVMASAVILVVSIPVGIANIWLGFILGESPCILCGIERFGMLLVGAIGVFILRYGPHFKYVSTLLLTSFFFLYTAFRHWGGHIPGDLGQGFGGATFGVHTYTWAMLIYWVVIAFIAVGMVFVGRSPQLLDELSGRSRPIKRLSAYSMIAAGIVLVLGVTNSFQFLVTNGPPPFTGMGDPPRFTADVTRSSDHWTFYGYQNLSDPGIHSFSAPIPLLPGEADDTDLPTAPAAGPVQPTGELTLADTHRLGFPVTGSAGGVAAGLAYDDATGRFGLVSTDGGMFFAERDLATVVASAALDAVNGADIEHTVDATFIGPDRLLAMAKNKTVYGAEMVDPADVDEQDAWTEFRESTGNVMGVFGVKERPKLRTVRAKNAYALSVAGDPSDGSYYVVSVPHERNPRIVVSQFADDNELASEAVLSLAGSADPSADAAAYYPVGADFRDGRLYLLSAAYSSVLVVDPATMTVESVQSLPEDLGNMTDVVVTGGTVYVLAHQDGTDVVHELTGLA